MKRLITTWILVGFATVVLADQNDRKLSKDLPAVASNAFVDVIIQFQPSTKKLQDHLSDLENMLTQLGGNGQQKPQRGQKVLNTINALHVRVPAIMIPWLKANPLIRYISPNRPTKRFLDVSTGSVSASYAWQNGWDGTGVGVAIIDSGIAPKHDLTGPNGVTSRVVYSESFVDGQGASDVYGHGTHVAGIIGSSGKDSSGVGFTRTFKGVAPNVNLINLRVLDANGGGDESDVIDAIERAIQLKNTYNIRVINLSLGRPVFESYTLDPLCQAVESAWKAGIVVVVAAGNFGRDDTWNTKGYGTIASPGNDPYVITVGAMNAKGTVWTADDAIASYSSKGPTLVDHIVKPDLVAPGNNVISLMAPNSTLAAAYPQLLITNATYETQGALGKSGDYFKLSGTSMATPVVSAAAALLIQKQPSLTPDQVKARLMKTARKALTLYSTGTAAVGFKTYNSQSDIFTVGAGYLNIASALSSNDMVTLPAMSPTAVYNSVTKKISIVRNLSILWGDSNLWNDAAVWGTVVFSKAAVQSLDDSVLWGDSVVWGDSTTAGFNALWGSSVNANTSLQALSADDDDQ